MKSTEVSSRLVAAMEDLDGFKDARDVARYVVAMFRDFVPGADALAVHVRIPGTHQFLCLGAMGFPQYPDTLLTTEDSAFGDLLGTRDVIQARNRCELVELVNMPDDGSESYKRHLHAHRLRADAAHRSLLIQPLTSKDAHVGCVWIESWTTSRPPTRSDLDHTALAARVAALAFRHCDHATVKSARGLMERRPFTDAEAAADDPAPSGSSVSAAPSSIVLSLREKQVLRLIASGLTNREIARDLRISENTVRTHRRSLMSKVEAHNSAELLTHARAARLLD
ncbi:helix-turn-helix transcriptional regulator [Corynebacterium uterequi]|uniref:Transcriptional regulator, luxR family n=1 Tax=Corynebacterium uterequi TaxID=1072256 RepID=A0A0G3HEG6_9CORY|nr:response regulator transcription factor [Corynebacterium uterequi]AKK11726.1 transcriptional regulator, luxR family [Corynebacterium uterequi]